MLKSGLIIGGVMLVLATITGFFFAPCIVCLALLAGAGAGYLAGTFERPGDQNTAVKLGASAGAIGGAGAWLGHIISGIGNAALTGPEAAADILRQFDLPADVSSPAGFYGGAFAGACCFGLFEIALMAGLGGIGGLVWYRMTNRGAAPGAPPPAAA